MERIRFTWHPTWTKEIERWTASEIHKWRFDPIDGFEDILQECRIRFWKLEKEYPIVNEDKHFFCLYKTSIKRMFIDKLRKKQRTVLDNICIEDIADQLASYSTHNYGTINLLINDLPDELKLVLRALTTGRVRLKLDRPTKALKVRETHNMRLKRRYNLTLDDPVGDLQKALSNS